MRPGKSNEELPTAIAAIAQKHPVLALVLLIANGALGLLRRLTSEWVLIAGIVAVTLIVVTMMFRIPPSDFPAVAQSFRTMVEALGKVASNSAVAVGGYVLSAVLMVVGTAIILVQRQRRKSQDEQLRALRERNDPSRQSSQMTFDDLLGETPKEDEEK